MKQNTVSFKLKKLQTMLADGSLTWNESIQRGLNAWKPEQKSALIHSILADYYIPSVCFVRKLVHDEKTGKDVSLYSILDGKQRLSVIFSYMNDEFKLHKSTPTLKLDNGEEFVLAGKKFSELGDLQEDINRFVPAIVTLEECTEEELEQVFARLNNGTPLTKVQKSRPIMGKDVAGYMNKLLESDFFNNCNLTKLQKSREDSLTALLQGLMLIDSSYTSWSGLGASEVSKYCEYLKDNFSYELQNKFAKVIFFLGEAFDDEDEKYTFLKRINIPVVIKAASEFMLYVDASPKDFREFICSFFVDTEQTENLKKVYNEYLTYCGEGSVNKEKVVGRVNTLIHTMVEYFGLDKAEKEDFFTEQEVLERYMKEFGSPKCITECLNVKENSTKYYK